MFDEIKMSINRFYFQDVKLKGDYSKDFELRSSDQGWTDLRYKTNVLFVKVDQENKVVTISIKSADDTNQEKIIDEIKVQGGKITCFDGEFKIDEVDDYLPASFSKLLD